MTRESRRRAEAERRKLEAPSQIGGDRYYLYIFDDWGTDRPLTVLRVRNDGGEERIGPGAVWKPAEGTLKRARRTQGYSAVPVDADTAERAAAWWAYEFQRIVDRETGRTVAFTRSYVPNRNLLPMEESTCRSGIWESTRRLARINQGLDDYAVEPVESATVEEHLRALQPPEYRYFAVVREGHTESGLRDPVEVLRVRTGQEKGFRERLGADWEPYDMINGVDGLRELTLLEIDEDAVAQFREQRPTAQSPQWTYFALLHGDAESVEMAGTVVRQRRIGESLYEEELRAGPRWTESNLSGAGTRETDPTAVEISADTVETMTARWRYSYYEILQPNGEKPIAVVRRYDAVRGSEEAAVGWPVWSPSLWLKQIADGRIAYRARAAEPAAVERFLRQAAADRSEYRYFAFLQNEAESIESARSMARMRCSADGRPVKEETPLRDGTWYETFSMVEINFGRGNWWLIPVEVPHWMFDRHRTNILEAR